MEYIFYANIYPPRAALLIGNNIARIKQKAKLDSIGCGLKRD